MVRRLRGGGELWKGVGGAAERCGVREEPWGLASLWPSSAPSSHVSHPQARALSPPSGPGKV